MNSNITHAPPNYVCPFCQIVRREFGSPGLLTTEDDIVFRSDSIVAWIASHWWPNNPGHVLVIPTAHFENMYNLSVPAAIEIHNTARQIAMAMKRAYNCTGISTRQHNEPSGGQDVFHYHLHIFPRFAHDELYTNHNRKRLTTPAERKPFSDQLKAAMVES